MKLVYKVPLILGWGIIGGFLLFLAVVGINNYYYENAYIQVSDLPLEKFDVGFTNICKSTWKTTTCIFNSDYSMSLELDDKYSVTMINPRGIWINSDGEIFEDDTNTGAVSSIMTFSKSDGWKLYQIAGYDLDEIFMLQGDVSWG